MKNIHLLPDSLIAKIAAGEVIERPAFAVKELIENSIDAKADYIRIEIEQGGLKNIQVIDNGLGMDKDDLLDCFKIHTTSKINIDESSLIGVKTLGFRGEALSSIAAVSNMIIQSRISDSTGGTQVKLKAGAIEKISPIGMPKGTIITVNNLFYTVPARKKFLKNLNAEYRFILEIVSNFILSFPNIHFVLINNGKTIFDLSKTENLMKRVQKILGISISSQLLPLSFEDSYIKGSGFITKPQIASPSAKQYIFINQRRIQDRMISLSIKEAYGNTIELNYFPSFIIFLELPYETVDVNIHPRKEQVSFLNSRVVFDVTKNAVLQTLSEHNLNSLSFQTRNHISPQSETGILIKQSTDFLKILNNEILDFSDIQQIHNLYLVTPTKKGILFIDQHAAHERILYEQFLKEFKNQKLKKEIIYLNPPKIVELSLSDIEILKDNITTFKKIEFDIEEFTENSCKITTIPKIFKDHDIENLILEILLEVSGDIIKDIDTQTDKLLKYISCRTAIKRGDKLTKKQARTLLEELQKTPNNITCPHSRPTKVEISLLEINKHFKR